MRKIFLASHGEYAKGLLDSAKMVLGPLADGVTAYSMYPGDDAEDYAQELEASIREHSSDEYIIITDIFGASVCTAMTRLSAFENVRVFTGMSFSMLLELLVGYQNPLSQEEVEQLLEVSRAGIRQVDLTEIEAEEDF